MPYLNLARCAISHLPLGQLRFDPIPRRALRRVGEQVHDDGTLANSLIHVEEVLARDPAILLRLFPACAVLAHTDDHVQAVIAEVQALAMALRAVADESEGVVLEVVLCRGQPCTSVGYSVEGRDIRGACPWASHHALPDSSACSSSTHCDGKHYRRPSPCHRRSRPSSRHEPAGRTRPGRLSGQLACSQH